jgi:hypothetical protein
MFLCTANVSPFEAIFVAYLRRFLCLAVCYFG